MVINRLHIHVTPSPQAVHNHPFATIANFLSVFTGMCGKRSRHINFDLYIAMAQQFFYMRRETLAPVKIDDAFILF
jgi:hypothetical protein